MSARGSPAGAKTRARAAGARRSAARRAPLAGQRILVTRPRSQARALCSRLRRLGAKAIAIPTIEILPPAPAGALDEALRRVEDYDWAVVTSANGARAILARARALRIGRTRLMRPRWAAIGPATARVLRRARIRVALMPSRFLTGVIPEELPDVRGRRILLPRTDVAPPDLAIALRRRGAVVHEIAAYRTVFAPAAERPRLRRLLAARELDIILLTSASTVNGLLEMLDGDRRLIEAVALACIGPVTAAAVVEAGLRPSLVAQEHTADGLVSALIAWTAGGRGGPARRRRTH